MGKIRFAAAAAGIAVGLFGVLPVATASAAARDGVCDPGEFCYYWDYGQGGSVSDFTTSVSNYGSTQPGCYEFKGPGDGQYECIKNNAASVWNRSNVWVTVFFNSGYTGKSQPIPPNTMTDLNGDLVLNNASHRFG